MNRSMLFAAYNRARHAAAIGRLERGRLDRALGLAMRRDQEPRYETTLTGCTCMDAQIHPATWCKHRIWLALKRKAGLASAEAIGRMTTSAKGSVDGTFHPSTDRGVVHFPLGRAPL
jgi:hypothetical protein